MSCRRAIPGRSSWRVRSRRSARCGAPSPPGHRESASRKRDVLARKAGASLRGGCRPLCDLIELRYSAADWRASAAFSAARAASASASFLATSRAASALSCWALPSSCRRSLSVTMPTTSLALPLTSSTTPLMASSGPHLPPCCPFVVGADSVPLQRQTATLRQPELGAARGDQRHATGSAGQISSAASISDRHANVGSASQCTPCGVVTGLRLTRDRLRRVDPRVAQAKRADVRSSR